ncbi:Cell surface protein [Aspergillus sclerotialis]|uniref:Cell surface protein n=1 Tax=Aspergillus sclerotialis TaxID=2070753 RepID=A0A3A2ZZV0_9EURO|nr:Cell surface protein [Aspergillus sclerotialis]
MKSLSISLVLSVLAATAVARTDLKGCTSSATVNQWNEASMIWFVPENGEICDFPDCGGGRAPPKYDVPGCPLYTGTATLTPSYLPGYGPGAKPTATGPPATGNPSSFTTSRSGTTASTTSCTECVTSTTSRTGTASSSRSLITPSPTGPSSTVAVPSSLPVPSESAVSSESATTSSQSSPNASSSEEPSSSPVVPISHGAAGMTGVNAAGVVLALAAALAVTV